MICTHSFPKSEHAISKSPYLMWARNESPLIATVYMLPPSGAQGEPSLAAAAETAAAETAAALSLPPHPAPCPEVLPGWGPSWAIARQRRRRGYPPASRPSRSRQPLAAGVSGAWNVERPCGPRASVRGSPGQPARRPQIEPWCRRLEAELCRGLTGYIVSSP